MNRTKQTEALLKLSDEKLTEKFLKQRGYKVVPDYRDGECVSYYLIDKDGTYEYSNLDSSTVKECWADAPSVLWQRWQNKLYVELVEAGYNIGTYPLSSGKVVTRICDTQLAFHNDIVEVFGRENACDNNGPISQGLDSLRRALAIASIIRDKENEDKKLC